MKKAATIRVTGKVQGVWFRTMLLAKAKERGVVGFVRNEPDGSIYIEAEGEEEAMKALIDWCWIGSEQAKVARVEMTECAPQGFTDFKIVSENATE